ncbi:MAG: hypothetical protein H6581_18915 [Bacteroidia bacterium]|nr:hypothetical protein [Bacteroidia bacterium]
MTKESAKEIVIRLNPEKFDGGESQVFEGIISAIQGLTNPGNEPISPKISEAIHTLTEILSGFRRND